MAMAGLERLVASHQGTVAHRGNNPVDGRNSTMKGKQEAAD
jgi:hypothetical protein